MQLLSDPSSPPALATVHATAPLRSPILWLQITLSGRFSAEQVRHWHQRLHAHLSLLGLVAAISPQRIAIRRMGGAVSPFDRGMVIGWLIAQPEVVLVRIDRHTAGKNGAGHHATQLTQEVNHG